MRERGRRFVALILAAIAGLTFIGTGAVAARRPAYRPAPSRAQTTADWADRYIQARGWSQVANSDGVIVYGRAMRPEQGDAFWARYERRYPTVLGGFVYRSVIQRVQVNCQTGEYRALETYYFRDNNRGGPSRHDGPDRASAWQTPLPDSLMESAVQWQCSPASSDRPQDPGPPPASDDDSGPNDDSGAAGGGK